jgi:transcriptional regulator of acetoin/glycerol metabolism
MKSRLQLGGSVVLYFDLDLKTTNETDLYRLFQQANSNDLLLFLSDKQAVTIVMLLEDNKINMLLLKQ